VRRADGDAALFYTSVSRADLDHGRVRVAEPADSEWGAWRKGEFVAEPPAGLELTAYRDPFVFRDGDGWSMLLGAGLVDGSGAVLAYASPDLTAWTYRGVAAARSGDEREPVWTGHVWECPQLVRFEDTDVLLVSAWSREALHHVAYGVGRWDDGRFQARSWGRLTFGGSFYAASAFRDAEDRPGMIAWLREVRGDDWTGALSVPYRFTLEGDRLVALPHPAVAAAAGAVDLTGETALAGATTARWTPRGTLELLTADGGLALRLRADGSSLRIEQPGAEAVAVPCDGGPVELVLDVGVLEVACDGGLFATPVAGTITRAVASGR
jgi:beta-fructofuranosidase